MNNGRSITLEDLIKAREELNKDPEPRIEIYPLSWKRDKDLNEAAEIRVKDGLGVWALPYEEEELPK